MCHSPISDAPLHLLLQSIRQSLLAGGGDATQLGHDGGTVALEGVKVQGAYRS
jgi:hypothetical protein